MGNTLKSIVSAAVIYDLQQSHLLEGCSVYEDTSQSEDEGEIDDQGLSNSEDTKGAATLDAEDKARDHRR